MNFKDLKEDDTFDGVLLETFRPKGASRPRVRPVSELPNDILVDFLETWGQKIQLVQGFAQM